MQNVGNADKSTFSNNLKAKLKAKQSKIAQARRAQEYHEIKDCTFKPQINGELNQPDQENAPPIKGLGRHLELKEL